MTTTPGTLTVSKLDTALAISVDSKTYDGSAVTPKVSTNPAFDGTYTVTYYPLDSETALPSAPTDAGQYRAVATVKDDKHFTDDTAACLFTISKAAPDVETPTIADLTYRAGLTLADVALPSGWTWDAPTTALSAGAVKANATYTPTDTANYTTVTRGLSFDVAQAAASITITGDPSKTYDGNAVTDPAVTKTSDGAVTYAYYTGADTTATPLASAPTGAGSYTVVATVAETADYKTASASRAFTIAKATPTPETPTLASLVYKDGLTLSDEALPAGWAWNEPTRAISVGTVSAYATYTPSDTANYTTVVQMLSFDVLEGQGTVSITEDVSQTFDGSAVGNPAVSKTGDGTVAYAYYAGTSASGTALASAPVDAGTYTVVATLAETKSYKGASDSATFAIAKRPVVLGISASQNGTSATVTVTAAGLSRRMVPPRLRCRMHRAPSSRRRFRSRRLLPAPLRRLRRSTALQAEPTRLRRRTLPVPRATTRAMRRQRLPTINPNRRAPSAYRRLRTTRTMGTRRSTWVPAPTRRPQATRSPTRLCRIRSRPSGCRRVFLWAPKAT